jgi:hypothetical protein
MIDLTFDEAEYPNLWRTFRHPRQFDCKATKAMLTNCTYLEDQGCDIEGIKIWGSPWYVRILSHWSEKVNDV